MPRLLLISHDRTLIEQFYGINHYEIVISTDKDKINRIIHADHERLFCVYDVEVEVPFDLLLQRYYPIIIVASFEQQGLVNDYLQRGAVDFLLKPTNPDLLQKRLANAHGLNVYTQLNRTISRDLRSPLTAIHGYATLLMDYPETFDAEKTKAMLNKICQAVERILENISWAQDVGRIISGDILLSKNRVRVGELLRKTVGNYQALNKGKPLQVELDIANGLPDLQGDEWRLEQALITILKALVKDEFRLSAQRHYSGSSIVIEITLLHTWRYMRDYQRHFEDLLSQYYIATYIVRRHGGQIDFEEIPGQQITVQVILPMHYDE
ncbi:MAG: hypothetical protein MUF87_13595 [Anaerolineae bacterium]|jgi:signal transduction histidine kinase|nr:hypothetical protein [Anaerolineae bacterium]